tara:strand:- start:3185 stop:3448 length:264 start_codon:yes stop_codon:yes gene_type:complete
MKTDVQERAKLIFLQSLKLWLDDDLIYYYLTGDRTTQLKYCSEEFVEKTLNRAWKEFPERLERIKRERAREEIRSKALVKQFVLETK